MNSGPRTSLIVAADERDGIGKAGGLPWHLPNDLRRFQRLTAGHVVVAGWRTQESIVRRLGHPLSGRITVVVTRQPDPITQAGVIGVSDPVRALGLARSIEQFAGRDEVFLIGGAQVYQQLLHEADRIYLTRVHTTVDADATMPAGWLTHFALVAQEPASPDAGDTAPYSLLTYERA